METTSKNPPPVMPAEMFPEGLSGNAAPPPGRANVLYANFARVNRDPRWRECRSPRLIAALSGMVTRSADQVRLAIRCAWMAALRYARRVPKKLLIAETAGLGDRRFVVVIQFEGQRFLIGSTPSSMTLLASLPDAVVEKEKSCESRVSMTQDDGKGAGQ